MIVASSDWFGIPEDSMHIYSKIFALQIDNNEYSDYTNILDICSHSDLTCVRQRSTMLGNKEEYGHDRGPSVHLCAGMDTSDQDKEKRNRVSLCRSTQWQADLVEVHCSSIQSGATDHTRYYQAVRKREKKINTGLSQCHRPVAVNLLSHVWTTSESRSSVCYLVPIISHIAQHGNGTGYTRMCMPMKTYTQYNGCCNLFGGAA
jgi:hypothetical protein